MAGYNPIEPTPHIFIRNQHRYGRNNNNVFYQFIQSLSLPWQLYIKTTQIVPFYASIGGEIRSQNSSKTAVLLYCKIVDFIGVLLLLWENNRQTQYTKYCHHIPVVSSHKGSPIAVKGHEKPCSTLSEDVQNLLDLYNNLSFSVCGIMFHCTDVCECMIRKDTPKCVFVCVYRGYLSECTLSSWQADRMMIVIKWVPFTPGSNAALTFQKGARQMEY